MSLIALETSRGPHSGWQAELQRVEPCPGASFECTSASATVVAWGEPHSLPTVGELLLAVRERRAGSLPGASWIHLDRSSGRIEAAVDRFGAFPILLGQGAQGWVLANHPLAMADALGARAEADPEALIELIGLGQLTGERSSLRGVRHLPANCHIVLDGTSQTASTGALIFGQGPRCSPEQALEAFTAAVDTRLRTAPGAMLPLSGGLDSRLILAAALASGHRPDCLVFGAPDSADVVIARELAASAGLNLAVGVLDRAAFQDAAVAIAAMGGGTVPLQHGHALCAQDLVARTSGRPLLTGTGAETFRAFYWNRGLPGCGLLGRPELRERAAPLAARWAREAFLRTLDPLAALLPEAGATLRAAVEAMIDEALSNAPDAAHGLDALYLGQRVRRFVVGGQQLLDADHARLHPYLEPSVVDSWSRLSPSLRQAGRFQRWAIQRLAPGLGHANWDVTMRPLADGLTWQERWPGVADRLGREGAWTKRGRTLGSYGDWLAPVSDQMSGLPPLLVAALPRLLSGPTGQHVAGVLGAWQQWVGRLTSRSGVTAPRYGSGAVAPAPRPRCGASFSAA